MGITLWFTAHDRGAIIFIGGAQQRPGIERAVFKEQQTARIGRVIRRRRMQRAGVMNGDAAGLDQTFCRFSRLKIRVAHCADKDAVLVMTVERALVRTGRHQHAAVLFSHVVQADADSQNVIIRMRVERPNPDAIRPRCRGPALSYSALVLCRLTPGPTSCSTISRMPLCRIV